jgi:hypothetical protein
MRDKTLKDNGRKATHRMIKIPKELLFKVEFQ